MTLWSLSDALRLFLRHPPFCGARAISLQDLPARKGISPSVPLSMCLVAQGTPSCMLGPIRFLVNLIIVLCS